ncbi:hypothetical protein Anapl_05771 [Anas platyrhynchos]|uniref:Uncharacterized protein n=1 Tax=Anas platyrhynchos TaxID=8839 RepID=R0M2N6_ANAPL|nr:hypothetical protein Anapl_05771 [Anas platyrhynchos]
MQTQLSCCCIPPSFVLVQAPLRTLVLEVEVHFAIRTADNLDNPADLADTALGVREDSQGRGQEDHLVVVRREVQEKYQQHDLPLLRLRAAVTEERLMSSQQDPLQTLDGPLQLGQIFLNSQYSAAVLGNVQILRPEETMSTSSLSSGMTGLSGAGPTMEEAKPLQELEPQLVAGSFPVSYWVPLLDTQVFAFESFLAPRPGWICRLSSQRGNLDVLCLQHDAAPDDSCSISGPAARGVQLGQASARQRLKMGSPFYPAQLQVLRRSSLGLNRDCERQQERFVFVHSFCQAQGTGDGDQEYFQSSRGKQGSALQARERVAMWNGSVYAVHEWSHISCKCEDVRGEHPPALSHPALLGAALHREVTRSREAWAHTAAVLLAPDRAHPARLHVPSAHGLHLPYGPGCSGNELQAPPPILHKERQFIC